MAEVSVTDPIPDEEKVKESKLIWCGKRSKSQKNEGNEPGVIFSQKWNNLLKTYKDFTLFVEKTGSGADVLEMKPHSYDEFQEILECVPQYVGDSAMETQNPTCMDIKSNRQKLKDFEIKKPPLNEIDDEALNNFHFSDDERDEEDDDEKHIEPRLQKRKRMIDLLAGMEKKREIERQAMRIEKQKRRGEKIDQTTSLKF
ncbi:hypothetical protein GHT06_020419 [Daphnia sinensis]|uniref:Uncharacterized protein n=1 Tax=Daphnia sinensis TaxID=1820382 RepID=A0AAD5KY14_9CRUS|nr:hypothetical protein GHT06_020419 [Daphnia sinensis]